MASTTLRLANSQCGGAMHVVGPKFERKEVSCVSFPPSLMRFTRRSTWDLKNLTHRREMNSFGLGAERKASQHAMTSISRNMSSGDTKYHEAKLIDANCLKTIDKNFYIKYKNGKEMEVKHMYQDRSRQMASEIDAKFGDSGMPCMFLQTTSAPSIRILAITTTEEILEKYTDHVILNQFLHKGVTEENEHIKFSGVWLLRGANGEYKLTFKFYIKKVKMECKLDMDIRALKLALEYNIPIYERHNILHEDGLRFPTITLDMERPEDSVVELLVDVRHQIVVADGRFSDAKFWETARFNCHIGTILRPDETTLD